MEQSKHVFRDRGLPIVVVLSMAVGLLSALLIGAVILANYSIARRSTVELLQERARLITDVMIERTRTHLAPVGEQVAYLAAVIAENNLAYGDRGTLAVALRSSLAGLKQVSSIAFVDRNLLAVRAFQNRPGQAVAVSDWSHDEETQRVWHEQGTRTGGSWGGFFFAEPVSETFLNVYHPVRDGDEFLGYLVAGVSIRELSTFLKNNSHDASANPFILYGRNAVAAHPAMSEGTVAGEKLSDAQPLPLLPDFRDSVLRMIWSISRDYELETALSADTNVRVVRHLDENHVFIFRELQGFSDKPLLVGAHMLLETAALQLDRIWFIPLIGIPALIFALLIAALIGSALGRPVRDLAKAALHIRHLDIDGAPNLPKGLFRELNEAAEAFNAMLASLRALETYVPRFLVTRLLEHHGDKVVESEDREITVMFTDIVGFTEKAENMSPSELTAFLNHHFEIVGREVEKELGVIDKYIGDAVMAFWGAPEPQADQALRACRAALAVGEALQVDNAARREAGLPPVHIRIGIHKGAATIGNIGSSNRVNYTVVGDTVNVAERIEGMSRRLIDTSQEVGILVSEEVAAQVGDYFHQRGAGEYTLKGKAKRMALYEITSLG